MFDETRGTLTVLWVLLLSLVMGCEKRAEPGANQQTGSASPATSSATVTLQGSGASFPSPIYSRWFREFSDKNPNVRVNYQATGSGAGIKAFIEGQTDFGASDAAMTDDEIKQAQGNVRLLPMTAGSIALTYNLEGVTDLKLSREAYVGIFLGEIKSWSDPKIVASNPGVKLPSQDVSVVHRSDGSGTTFVFTQHLSAINAKWKSGPGAAPAIEWPVGVGGRKNDGVAALVSQTPGAIGYVEYAFAKTSNQPVALLENKGGKFVAPTLEASAQSLTAVELPDDLRAWVTDPEGAESYPIVTYTWILAKKKYADPARAKALKDVLSWCLTEGQKMSASLYYVPLPEGVSKRVLDSVHAIE